jgi:hypothetical protein
LLENGKSLFDYLPAEQSGQMRADAAQNGEDYKITSIPVAAFAVNAEDTAWVDAMCVKQPLAKFEQKLALAGRQVPKRVYILAAGGGGRRRSSNLASASKTIGAGNSSASLLISAQVTPEIKAGLFFAALDCLASTRHHSTHP